MAVPVKPFWQRKTLADMSSDEWESLCDGCGKCCLHKLQDEDTDEVYYTNVACRYLDHFTCRCKDYSHRAEQVPECITLTVADIDAFHWLPNTCAYRLVAEGKDLPSWHHLVSGSRDSVHNVDASVAGRVIAEGEVDEDNYEEHVIHWVE